MTAARIATVGPTNQITRLSKRPSIARTRPARGPPPGPPAPPSRGATATPPRPPRPESLSPAAVRASSASADPAIVLVVPVLSDHPSPGDPDCLLARVRDHRRDVGDRLVDGLARRQGSV